MKKLKVFIFYILSFTWGLPMSLAGLLVAGVLMLAGYKPKRFHHLFYFEVGENWGGVELGCFFVVNKNPSLHIKQHEAGHGIQNIVFGPLMPFIVSIPSAIRYWNREYLYRTDRKKYYELPDYDSVWFEGQATRLGEKYFESE